MIVYSYELFTQLRLTTVFKD